jgi:hypothetical protein
VSGGAWLVEGVGPTLHQHSPRRPILRLVAQAVSFIVEVIYMHFGVIGAEVEFLKSGRRDCPEAVRRLNIRRLSDTAAIERLGVAVAVYGVAHIRTYVAD